ncbi:MAG: hypothetical protein RL151_1442 [Bacteroidota bacterium]
MAINQNHPFEELDGRRCAVVERNVSPERVDFLKYILDGNGYTVVVVPSPPPKAVPAPKLAEGEEAPAAPPPPPATFTVGVTDVTFNAINAIYGRSLRSPEGRVVTMAYWQQKEEVSNDTIPYYERNNVK